MSEMAFARMLVKRDRKELPRLRRFEGEELYGFQVATNVADEAVKAAELAAEHGAFWLDLNCGCPIYEATRRGVGAALLSKPTKLAKLVARVTARSPLPVTVKIRLGETDDKDVAHRLVPLLAAAGAAAVIVHARSAEARYRKPARWPAVERLAADNAPGRGGARGVPIIGNGDLLTHYEVAHRRASSGCLALMTGRGALIKPWLFQEVQQGHDLQLSAADRVGEYRRFVSYMKDYFHDDARGKASAFYFLPWHFGFFCRYRSLPEDVFGLQESLERPLIARRHDVYTPEMGETLESVSLLERLLRCGLPEAHEHLAHTLWDAGSDADAVCQLESLAESRLHEWERLAKSGDSASLEDSRAEG